MFSDPRKISIVLHMINRHPRDLVPFSADLYHNYFSASTVPAEKIFTDQDGEPSVMLVSKQKALKYLKEKYRFTATSEIEQVLKEDDDDNNL